MARPQDFVNPITPAELAAREQPWHRRDAPGGARFPYPQPLDRCQRLALHRHPRSKYVYEVPSGKAALAAAETYVYGADVVLKIDPADVGALGGMLTFLEGPSAADLPAIADLAVVEDGTAVTGEVMNSLTRRNLLFQHFSGVDALPDQHRHGGAPATWPRRPPIPAPLRSRSAVS